MPVHPVSVVFGRVIREARNELGWTQAQVGRAAGLHRNYVGALERCEGNPTLPKVFAIAAALRLKPSELVAEVEAADPG